MYFCALLQPGGPEEIVLITAKHLAYDTHSLKLEGRWIFALSRCLDTNPYWLHYAADYSWAEVAEYSQAGVGKGD